MECNEYRHVCLKDLENYFKKDQYFGDLSEEEIKLIQKNLGINASSSGGTVVSEGNVIKASYQQILAQMQISNLKVNSLYVIDDFQTIYSDIDGITHEGPTYWLFLTPNSTSSFDTRVRMLSTDPEKASTSTKWIVEYDINPNTLLDGTQTKGTITYLKDQNNNYAYYDFKNMKFKKTLSELNKGAETYTEDTLLYTFDLGGIDGSETVCKNNHLEKGASRNVFLNVTNNVSLSADCHDNIFFKQTENCDLGYGTRNNYFISEMKLCSGSVHDKTLGEVISMTCPKQFNVCNDTQVLIYLDPETQTFQVRPL